MSVLLDPNDLVVSNSTVRSPSGNELGRNAYLTHPDRPLCIRERQEKVKAEVEAAIRNANRRRVREAAEAIKEDDAEDAEDERQGWCSMWCFQKKVRFVYVGSFT